ncbi:SDR family NAD(P)-dependent oxidoreductase [Sphingomonadaceae bacterium jetA1]|uniref:SDR family oxidoreductase n=1 Tax=Facivitalis istanbulensis TaxID=3075838 RepID=UPI00347C6FF3
MTDITGKNAVVVAGGNGIGRSIAHALADAGANVVIADIRKDDAEKVRDEVVAKGRKAIAIQTDVSRLDAMQALADAAFDAFGTIEILVNNAGVAVRPMRAIWDTSYADLQYMININIWGLLHGYHVFLPRMRAQTGEKHIVNTSSMASMLTIPGMAIYTMSKEATDGFSRVTAEELRADGFNTTILYPGQINTAAHTRSGELRSAEERAADAAVKPFASYAEERGEALIAGGAGRGPVRVLGGTHTSVAIEPELVGPMVVRAIRENRPVCMTHRPPEEGIRMIAEAQLDGYHP